MPGDSAISLVLVHILQFSVVIILVGLVVKLTGRRWPHFTFLLCMLALIKCLIPPLVPSPAGLFTVSDHLAWSSDTRLFSADDAMRLKHTFSENAAGLSRQTTNTFHSPVSLQALIVSVWLGGSACFVVLGIFRYQRTIRLTKCFSNSVPDSLVRMVEELRQLLGMANAPKIAVSSRNYGPALVGILTPTLVIPQIIVETWPERLIRPIVTHEMVHARRRDMIWGCLQFVAQTVWWFHPLIWFIGRRAHMLCERCVDEETLAALKCSAADYAESLVQFLQLRNSLRPVPSGHGISFSQMTSERLERLMHRYGMFRPKTSTLSWIIAIAMAAVVLPGAAWVSAQDERQQTVKSATEYRDAINAALATQDWKTAEARLSEVLTLRPNDERATFLKGYVVHAQGRLDEAIELHTKATKFPSVKAAAFYNLACALSLKGETNSALDSLEKAVAAGMRPQDDIQSDPDLNSLLKEARFLAIVAKLKTMTPGDVHKQFDFWIGDWNVFGKDGKQVGRNKITRSENGFLITERWTSAQGTTGTSINYFDASDKSWKQTWVDAKGSVIRYSGKFDNGKMKLKGTTISPNGKTGLSRMTFTPNPDRSVSQLMENSTDDGKTWTVAFDGKYVSSSGNAPRIDLK